MFGYIGLRCLRGTWGFGFRSCLPVLILFWFIWSKVAHPCAKYLNPILPDWRMWNIWWWAHIKQIHLTQLFQTRQVSLLAATSICSWIQWLKNFRVPIICHNYTCHPLLTCLLQTRAYRHKHIDVIDEPLMHYYCFRGSWNEL